MYRRGKTRLVRDFFVQKAGANGLKIRTKPEESVYFKPNAQYIVQSRR